MSAAIERVAQADIYSRERSGIIERLETGLHPSMRWRDPREISAGMMTSADMTPFAHTLAGACVWLRQRKTGRHDVSGDLLWCMVMQDRCDDEAQRVVTALVAAWLDLHASVAKYAQTPAGLASVQHASRVLVWQCVTGVAQRARIKLRWELWQKMQASGERMLWGLADAAATRATNALR